MKDYRTFLKETPNYSPICGGNFEDGSLDWLKTREHWIGKDPLDPDYVPVTIGGSDTAKVLGISPWGSREELWAKKSEMGEVKPRPTDEVILQTGHQLEEFVALTFARLMKADGHEVVVQNDTNMYQHPFYPWAIGNLDRRAFVDGEAGILECKTSSNWDAIKKYWQNGICPPYYESQVRYYMAIMNLNVVWIACCWGMAPQDAAVIRVDRDLETEISMMAAIEEFVDCCESGMEPDITGDAYIEVCKYYERKASEIPETEKPVEIPASEKMTELMEEMQDFLETKKRLEEKMKFLDQQEAELCARVLQATGGESSYVSYRLDEDTVLGVKLKIPMHRAGFDAEKLQKEEPEVFEKYQKTEISFDTTKYKKENKEAAKKYIIPATVDSTKAPSIKEIKVKNIPLKKEE